MFDQIIHIAKRGRFGARKYAQIPSLSGKDIEYLVTKVRLRHRPGTYRYLCQCVAFVVAGEACKHIRLFRELEKQSNVAKN